MKFVSTPSGKVEHKEFLHKTKQYIEHQKQNTSPHTMLNKGAKAGINKSTLQTVSSRGQKYSGPKRDFVEVDAWDTKLDGDLAKATVVDEVIHGKQRRGVWVLRGRIGVWGEENFESKVAEDITIEEDNEGLFGDERKALKRKTLEDGLNALEASRAKVAVQGPRVAADMSVEDMLTIVARTNGDDKNRSGSAQGEVAVESDDQGSDSEVSTDDEKGALDAGVRLRTFFSSVSASAKANSSKSTSSVSSAKLAKACPGKSSSSANSSEQKKWRTLGTQPGAAAASAAAATTTAEPPKSTQSARSGGAAACPREELKLDGRTSRLRANLERLIEELEVSLRDLLRLHLPRPGSSNQSGEKLKNHLQEKRKAASALKTQVANALKRVGTAKCPSELQDIVQVLNSKSDICELVLSLCRSLASAATASHEEMVTIFDELDTAGVAMTKGMREHQFWAKAQHLMTFSDVDGLCSMCTIGSPQRKVLAEGGCAQEDIVILVSDLVGDIVLELMQSGFNTPVSATVPISECTTKKTLCELVTGLQHAQADNKFMITVNLDILVPLINPNCDAVFVTRLLEKHDAYMAGQELGDADPVTKFIFNSNAGKAMLETIKVDSGQYIV